MHKLPGFVLMLFIVASVWVFVSTPGASAAGGAGDAHPKQADDDDVRRREAQREAVRRVYLRQIERVSAEIANQEARLRRLMIEHPGEAGVERRRVTYLQKTENDLMLELTKAQAVHHVYLEQLEAGDFEPGDATALAIEQSPQIIEIDRELRPHRVQINLFDAIRGDNADHPLHERILGLERQVAAIEIERDAVFDRMARLHFNARLEGSARRVARVQEQLRALEPEIAEAEARYADAVRVEVERAAMLRRMIDAERRYDDLVLRLQDAELEADLAAARGE